MKYIEGQNRNQLVIFPTSLNDAIDQDNDVRFIDLFVESLDIADMGFKVDHVEDGRPAYHPQDLLKLYLYGYLNSIRSSRKLEKETRRNILHQVNQQQFFAERNIRTEINIKETELFAPFNYKIDKYETISRILIHDTQRNSLILNDIENNAKRFKTILVLSERKAHVDILNLYLKEN